MTERLYYLDPHARTFRGRVTGVAARGGRVALALDRTLFYPEGGGQPADRGTLAGAPVVDVQEDGPGDVWHVLERPAAPATVGDEVEGAVDPARRLDHMQQHTGQHLLSAVLLKLCGAETRSFHLGEEASTIDVAWRDLAPSLLDLAEDEANRLILEGIPVSTTVESGDRRIVEIAGVDRQPCCGTHCARLSEVRLVRIAAREKGKGGLARIHFLCGERALRDYRARAAALDGLARSLTTAWREVPAQVEKLREQARAAERRAAGLSADLIASRGRALLASAREVGACRLARARHEGSDPRELGALADAILVGGPRAACVLGMVAAERAHLLVARGSDLAVDLSPALSAGLAPIEGKGGGRGPRLQGSGPRAGGLDAAIDAAALCLEADLQGGCGA